MLSASQFQLAINRTITGRTIGIADISMSGPRVTTIITTGCMAIIRAEVTGIASMLTNTITIITIEIVRAVAGYRLR